MAIIYQEPLAKVLLLNLLHKVKKIIACPSECATCSTSSTCLSCNSGYSLDGSTCVSCPQKMFAFSGICVGMREFKSSLIISSDCPATCAECTDASTCQSCVDGYGLYGGQCADCPSSTTYSNGECIGKKSFKLRSNFTDWSE